MQRQRRRINPSTAAATTTDADKRVHESTGLSMSANGGWSHIISFSDVCDRTQVMSLVCVAFLRASSALPRSAEFDLELLGGVSAFSLDKIRAAHARFPALRDVMVEVGGEYENVVPGLQLMLPQLAGCTSITSLNLRYQGLVPFPASLCALTGLKKLNLCRNKIAALPDAIGDLKELTHLNVSRWRALGCSSVYFGPPTAMETVMGVALLGGLPNAEQRRARTFTCVVTVHFAVAMPAAPQTVDIPVVIVSRCTSVLPTLPHVGIDIDASAAVEVQQTYSPPAAASTMPDSMTSSFPGQETWSLPSGHSFPGVQSEQRVPFSN